MKKRAYIIIASITIFLIGAAFGYYVRFINEKQLFNAFKAKLSDYECYLKRIFIADQTDEFLLYNYPLLEKFDYVIYIPATACIECFEKLLYIMSDLSVCLENSLILTDINTKQKVIDIASVHNTAINVKNIENIDLDINDILIYSLDLPYTVKINNNDSRYIVELFLSTTKS